MYCIVLVSFSGEVKSSHAMFPVVCQKFVHAMGPDTMIPAKSMDAAQDLDLLKIVLRKTKRSYLFWEKVKHTVLDFHVIVNYVIEVIHIFRRLGFFPVGIEYIIDIFE